MPQYDKQWDPKYAALGVLTIALAILLLDFLPGMIRERVQKPFQSNKPGLY